MIIIIIIINIILYFFQEAFSLILRNVARVVVLDKVVKPRVLITILFNPNKILLLLAIICI